MKPRNLYRLAFPLASAIAALLSSQFIHADQNWDGGGGDNNWNTAANWGSNVLPTFGTPINFLTNTRNTAVNNLIADTTIGGINFTNTGIATGNLSLLAAAVYAQEIDMSVAAASSGDLSAVTGTLSITAGAILTLAELGTSGMWDVGDTITLIGYSTGTWNGGLFTYLGNTLTDGDTFTFSGIDWTFEYNDTAPGDNFLSDTSSFTSSAKYVTMTAVPEPRAALLGGLGLVMLLRRRRSK